MSPPSPVPSAVTTPGWILPRRSDLKDLLEERDRVLGAQDSVSRRAGVGKDLVVVPTLVRLVAEEVDRLETLVGDEAERIGLVPTVRAD